MKNLLLVMIAITASLSVQAVTIGLATGSSPEDMTCDSEDFIPCAITTTTILPVIIVLDGQAMATDDAMLVLANELDGTTDSTEMTEKLARHFKTSKEAVQEAGNILLNTKEGLSFQGLQGLL